MLGATFEPQDAAQKLVARTGIAPLQFSETFDDAEKLLLTCEARKMEGILSKRASVSYAG